MKLSKLDLAFVLACEMKDIEEKNGDFTQLLKTIRESGMRFK